MSHFEQQTLCSACLTLPLLSIPTLPRSWNKAAIPSKAHPTLHSLLNPAFASLCRSSSSCSTSPPQSSPTPPITTPASSEGSIGHPYHISLASLHAAARAGCSICGVVQRSVDEFLTDWDEECKEDKRRGWRKRGEGEGDGGLDWKSMSVARGRNDTGGFMVLVRDVREAWVAWVVAAVGVVVEDADPLAPLIRGRKIDTSCQGIEASLNRAVKWVNRCDERCSGGCHPLAFAPLPARVLDLGVNAAEEDVVLYEPAAGETGKYAALSYVGGETNPYTTTRADLEEKKKGIDVGRLPKTIGDAVRVARKLGVRFLWVDALCTTQDEAKQHPRSTPPTASIYSNAYIVLSATGSPSATSGISIFSPNRVAADRYHGFSYSTTTTTENNEEEELNGTVYACPSEKDVAVYYGTHDLISEQPLSQRAWALQERWLARRVLYFSSPQMFFECSCGIWGEEGFYHAGKGGNSDDDDDSATSALSSLTLSSSSYPSEAAFLGGKKTWQEVIEAYASLNLTYPADKLPALANLARAYHRQQDRCATGTNITDEYVAGFWRSELLGNLIWDTVGTTTPSPVYRSPSWSWAAIDGPFGIFTPGQGRDVRGQWNALASVLSYDVVLKDKADPYGEIEAATLTLRTPLERLLPPTSNGEEEPLFPSEQKAPKMKAKNGNKDFLGGPFDSLAHAEMARGRELFAAVLWWCFEEGSGCGQGVPYYHTVIVARVQGERKGVGVQGNVYERLGKMPMGKGSLGECAWMDAEGKVGDEGALETIVLV